MQLSFNRQYLGLRLATAYDRLQPGDTDMLTGKDSERLRRLHNQRQALCYRILAADSLSARTALRAVQDKINAIHNRSTK